MLKCILGRSIARKLGLLWPLLSKSFPKKIWTKFESDQFRRRFGERSVIPIWFADAPPGAFDESTRVGGMTLNPDGDLDEQITTICSALIRKVAEERGEEERATGAREQSPEDAV
jgi:hypothetical protein